MKTHETIHVVRFNLTDNVNVYIDETKHGKHVIFEIRTDEMDIHNAINTARETLLNANVSPLLTESALNVIGETLTNTTLINMIMNLQQR